MNRVRASLVVFLAAFVLAFAAVLTWPVQASQMPVEAPAVTVTAVCTTDADCEALDAWRAEADGNDTVGVLDDGTCPSFTDPTPWVNDLGVTPFSNLTGRNRHDGRDEAVARPVFDVRAPAREPRWWPALRRAEAGSVRLCTVPIPAERAVMAYGQFLHGMNDWERRSQLHSDETDLMIQWDQIEKATAAGHLGGRGTYLILAPSSWMYDAVEWRTFRVVHSDEVDHPMLVIDPHWRKRHDESLQRRAES